MELNYRAARACILTAAAPQFMHDCSECVFVGTTTDGKDVWIHKDGGSAFQGDSIVLRVGHDGPDYQSMDYPLACNIADRKPGGDWAQAIKLCNDLELDKYWSDLWSYHEDVLVGAGRWERVGELDRMEIRGQDVLFYRDQHGNLLLRVSRCNGEWVLSGRVDQMSWVEGHSVDSLTTVSLIAQAIAYEVHCS